MFRDDQLDTSLFGEPAQTILLELLGTQLELGASEIGPLHLIVAADRANSELTEQVFEPAMKNRQQPREMLDELREEIRGPDTTPGQGLTASQFSSAGHELLSELLREFPADRPQDAGSYARVMAFALKKLTPRNRRTLGYFFDLDAVGVQRDDDAGDAGSLFDAEGQFSEQLAPDAKDLLTRALRLTGQTGHQRCLLTHLAIACLQLKHKLAQQAFRVYGRGECVADAYQQASLRLKREFPTPAPRPKRDSFSDTCLQVLDRVASQSQEVTAIDILIAVLFNVGEDVFAKDALTNAPLWLKADQAAAFLKKSLSADPHAGGQGQWAIASELASLENLSARLGSEEAPTLADRPQREQLERGLFSKELAIVLGHGEPGVGLSSLVESTAQGAARGQIPFLSDAVFLRADASAIPADSRQSTLRRLLSTLHREPRVVLVIESFHLIVESCAAELRALQPQGGRNEPFARVVGLCTTSDFRMHVAVDSELRSRSHTFEVPPADRETTDAILLAIAPALEQEYDVAIRRAELPRIAQLATRFTSDAQAPKAQVQLLRRACDEANFVAHRTGAAAEVGYEAATKVVADRTGMRQEQILSERGASYYEQRLGERVIGQPEAVQLAARYIHLAAHGAKADKRPAGIFLAAGQSGVGKSLLAKEMARLYSAQGTLHTFDMAQFKTPHTASRFTGPPPGYVGFDQGGALVNALLQQQNSVVVFEEVEKAHPEIWDVCLQLFSEGWIEDPRPRRAWATQTMFVLTSNLGQNVINAALEAGRSLDEIGKLALDYLHQARHEETGAPCFKPEFLNRVHGVIIFRPLDEQALREIALLEIDKVVNAQRDTRSVILCSATGEWETAAQALLEHCRGAREHGRGPESKLRDFVSIPLAEFRVPLDRPLQVTLTIDNAAALPRFNLRSEDGQTN